jgi:ATP-dependent DNA helicase RecQ
VDAQKFLSCIFRVHKHGNFAVGMNHIIDVLRGSSSEKILKWGHQNVSTYGAGKDKSKQEWMTVARQMLQKGYAALGGEWKTLSLTHDGVNVLRERTPIILTKTLEQAAVGSSVPVRAGDIPCDDMLFARLRELRRQLAEERNVPPYVVFSDVSLRHMARSYPVAESDFLSVPGVGFIAAIRDHLANNPRQNFLALGNAPVRQKMKVDEDKELSTTVMETLHRYKQGKTIEEIARIRSIAITTVEGHLAQAIIYGERMNKADFLTPEEDQAVRDALLVIPEWDGKSTAPIFQQLGGRVPYGKIRLALAFLKRPNP